MKNKYVFWRVIAAVCGVWISLFFVLSYFTVYGELKKYYFLVLIPLAVFMIFSEIYLMLFPLDLSLYIVWVYIFSYLAMAYGTTALAMMIFYCACYLGIKFRLFGEKKYLKIIIAVFLLVISAVPQIRLSKPELLRSLEEFAVSISAVAFMTYINFYLSKKINQDIIIDSQKENIQDYFSQYNFTERDKKMLEEVLSGCKYEEIALNHNLSLSSIKQRLGFLYRKLGVSCQIDFLIKFAPKSKN